MKDAPRVIDPARTFEALVGWFHDMLVQEKAPGFLVGLSGTDSLVTFLAAAKACERAGKPNRILGVHFAPSEDFLYDHPEAETHLWFFDNVIPWLRKQTPSAEIIVDSSIDWRCDGQRWGYLMDLSVVTYEKRRLMRLPEEQYWVVGTRNRTEDVLYNYSNVSVAASLQPIIHLWKSEILKISEHLGIPQIAIDKSCETDCICGRLALPSRHISEVDMLLMARCGEIASADSIPSDLREQLSKFITSQILKANFKYHIPYKPSPSVVRIHRDDPLVAGFEDGTLNLKEFNHRKHLSIAWFYLKEYSFEVAVERYVHYLQPLLDAAGQSQRFSLAVTRQYFVRLKDAMTVYPTDNFDELVEKSPSVLGKI